MLTQCMKIFQYCLLEFDRVIRQVWRGLLIQYYNWRYFIVVMKVTLNNNCFKIYFRHFSRMSFKLDCFHDGAQKTTKHIYCASLAICWWVPLSAYLSELDDSSSEHLGFGVDLHRHVLPLLIELMYLHPQFHFSGELGPAVHDGAWLGHHGVDLPSRKVLTVTQATVTPHLDRQSALCAMFHELFCHVDCEFLGGNEDNLWNQSCELDF